MKIPKKVIIAGRTFNVIFDKSITGGEWSSVGFVKINPNLSAEQKMQTFLHEIFEAILAMRNHRYESYPDDNALFVFDHRELIQIIWEFYQAIKLSLDMK